MPLAENKIFDKTMVLSEGEKYDPTSFLGWLRGFVKNKKKKQKSPVLDLMNSTMLADGTILGKPLRTSSEYRRMEALGRGAFGQVYLVVKPGAEVQKFAMKLLSKENILREKAQKMVLNEVLIMEHLNEAFWTVHLIDAFEDKDNVYLIQELCDGGDVLATIQRYFDQFGLFTEKDASSIVRHMIQAVKEVHDLGVVHRDLKPENFMFASAADGSMHMKLGDFGLAAFLPPKEHPLTESCGTPNFIAPEMWRAEPYDEKVDVWSLGVCLSIMLAGIYPYDGPQLMDIGMAACTPINFTVLPWTALSPQLVDLIQRMLEVDRERRITLEEALQHPWVVKGGAPDKKLDTRLKTVTSLINRFNVLTRMCVDALWANLEDAERAQFKANFDELDLNKDGVLTLEEVRYGFSRTRKIFLAPEAIDRMFDAMDFDKDGLVHLKDFTRGGLALRLHSDENKLVRAFQLMDLKNDGFLDKEELLKAIEPSGHPVSHVDLLMANMDQDRDGLISYEDFHAYYMNSVVGEGEKEK